MTNKLIPPFCTQHRIANCMLSKLTKTTISVNTWPHIQLFYGSVDFVFVWDNLGEPVPEETFTHSYLSWSSIIPFPLHPLITIHGIFSVQFACLTVFCHNLSPSFIWSTSWPDTIHFMLHTFLHTIIVFFYNTCTYHCNVFCCSTEIMSSNPSLSQPFIWNSIL